jgi:hypothetical protein
MTTSALRTPAAPLGRGMLNKVPRVTLYFYVTVAGAQATLFGVPLAVVLRLRREPAGRSAAAGRTSTTSSASPTAAPPPSSPWPAASRSGAGDSAHRRLVTAGWDSRASGRVAQRLTER